MRFGFGGIAASIHELFVWKIVGHALLAFLDRLLPAYLPAIVTEKS